MIPKKNFLVMIHLPLTASTVNHLLDKRCSMQQGIDETTAGDVMSEPGKKCAAALSLLRMD